jgi:hypothetical protein
MSYLMMPPELVTRYALLRDVLRVSHGAQRGWHRACFGDLGACPGALGARPGDLGSRPGALERLGGCAGAHRRSLMQASDLGTPTGHF